MDDFCLKIGESSTFPTDIYLKVRGKKLRAVRTTDLEKLTIEEIKDLSREILIQRKVCQKFNHFNGYRFVNRIIRMIPKF